MSDSIRSENVTRVRYAVSGLLYGLEGMKNPISLLEQATALEQVAQSLRVRAAANAQSNDLAFWTKNAID